MNWKIDFSKMDKKVLIGIVAGICVVVLGIILVVCAIGSKPGSNQPTESQQNTETEKDSQPEKESHTQEDSQSELQNTTENSQDTETQKESQTEIDTTPSETESQEPTESQPADTTKDSEKNSEKNSEKDSEKNSEKDSQGNSESDSGTQSSENPGSTEPTEPQEPVEGSKEKPYYAFPDFETFSLTTEEIEPGKSLFYEIYRIGNMIVTIEDANAYVIYNGVRYDAVKGKVQFAVGNVIASASSNLEIGNKGSKKASFVLKFANKEGSYANPVKITSMDGSEKKSHLEEGNEVGYYYSYVAEKTGTLKITLSSTTNDAKGGIRVTNNSNSAQEVTGSDNTVEIQVTEGDPILINVFSVPNDEWQVPETDITWKGEIK